MRTFPIRTKRVSGACPFCFQKVPLRVVVARKKESGEEVYRERMCRECLERKRKDLGKYFSYEEVRNE